MKDRLIFALQRAIATIAAALPGRRAGISWVVGVDEIASMLTSIAAAVPGSSSVCIGSHAFYDYRYDYSLASHGGRIRRALSAYVRAPWVFGRLSRRATGFIYLGAAGFLHSQGDHRRFEFGLLHRKGVKIVCFFLGDDIRAPRLMHALEARQGRPNASTKIGMVSPIFESEEYDSTKRGIAAVADAFADLIFSAPIDQSSYLTRSVEPIMYFFADADVARPRVPSTGEPLTVFHAPSNPFIKGTPEVQDAIAQLKAEGIVFDYVESMSVPNYEIRRALETADIVLNQFYTFVPGVFGVEALAAGAAVLMSADERLEPAVPPGSRTSWVVTRPDEIADHLRSLLLDRDRIAVLSERGVAWVRENAVASRSGAILRDKLDALISSAPVVP